MCKYIALRRLQIFSPNCYNLDEAQLFTELILNFHPFENIDKIIHDNHPYNY